MDNNPINKATNKPQVDITLGEIGKGMNKSEEDLNKLGYTLKDNKVYFDKGGDREEIIVEVGPTPYFKVNTLYTDINGGTATIPKGFKVSTTPSEQTVENGLVILDKDDTVGVRTTLIYGAQWDEALKFIETRGVKDTNYTIDSTGKGNYSVSLANTGSNINYAKNNIYDMAGNVNELTMEDYSEDVIMRGGIYFLTGSSNPASYRKYYSPNYASHNTGFRVALYIKIN